MDMPPSRYKVVEKGRRLVVIDTMTGQSVTGDDRIQQARIEAAQRSDRRATLQPRAAPAPSAASQPRPMRSGGARFTTDGWYDSKAPREIQLTENAQIGLIVGGVALILLAMILIGMFGLPVLIVGAVLLANLRKGVRASITLWLDAYALD